MISSSSFLLCAIYTSPNSIHPSYSETFTTTFPKCPPPNKYTNPSPASSNPKTRSTTGFTPFSVMNPIISSNLSLGPLRIPFNVTFLKSASTLVFSRSPGASSFPDRYPIQLIKPPNLMHAKERRSVRAPPFSKMMSAPREEVRARTDWSQEGVVR